MSFCSISWHFPLVFFHISSFRLLKGTSCMERKRFFSFSEVFNICTISSNFMEFSLFLAIFHQVSMIFHIFYYFYPFFNILYHLSSLFCHILSSSKRFSPQMYPFTAFPLGVSRTKRQATMQCNHYAKFITPEIIRFHNGKEILLFCN